MGVGVGAKQEEKMTVRMESIAHWNLWTRLFGKPLQIVRTHQRVYFYLNLFYYSIIVVGMIYAALNPALQQTLMQSVGVAFSQGPLQAVTNAYVNAQIVQATALTFVVNLFIGSFGTITLPSLIIPFSGLAMGAYRALLWGLIYSPTTSEMQFILLPHSLTLLLEGQAYVLAMLGVVIQGRGLLQPRTVGATSHREGFWIGIKQTAQLYILVVAVLLLGAIYEVLEAVLILQFIAGQS